MKNSSVFSRMKKSRFDISSARIEVPAGYRVTVRILTDGSQRGMVTIRGKVGHLVILHVGMPLSRNPLRSPRC